MRNDPMREFELTRFTALPHSLERSRRPGARTWARAGIRRTSPILVALVLLCSVASLNAATPVMASASPPSATLPEAVSVAYQLDAAHDGDQPNETLPIAPTKEWSDTFGSSVSYPLIVGGRVFVTTFGYGEGTAGSELYALDASNGNVIWGPIELGSASAGITYNNGLVFAINFGGDLTAFDAATGTVDWGTSFPGVSGFSAPPTVGNGGVYVSGGGVLFAVDEINGELLWSHEVNGGLDSSPAVSDTGVYVSYSCEQAYDYAPTTGELIWNHQTWCTGGGGRTPVLHDGDLYIRDDTGSFAPAVLSASTGNQLATFSSTTPPAFDNSLEFTMENGVLTATKASTGTVLWSQTADGSLDSAPIVVGGTVYVAGSSGIVAAFNESTGVESWSANAGSPITGGEFLTGLAAGDGLLVVPASDTLVAYGGLIAPSAPNYRHCRSRRRVSHRILQRSDL